MQAAPTASASINTASPFQSTWRLVNLGDAPAKINFVIDLTRTGANKTFEFSSQADVLPGGGTFQFGLDPETFVSYGIIPGDYAVTFKLSDDVTKEVIKKFNGSILRLTPATEPAIDSRDTISNSATGDTLTQESGTTRIEVDNDTGRTLRIQSKTH